MDTKKRIEPEEAAALVPELNFDIAFHCRDIFYATVERYHAEEYDDITFSVLAGFAAIYEAGRLDGAAEERIKNNSNGKPWKKW